VPGGRYEIVDRYASVPELMADLSRYAEGAPVLARRRPTLARLWTSPATAARPRLGRAGCSFREPCREHE
jgi:hypothetical protein